MRIGVMLELTPRIRKTLKIFDPTIFPTAISGCFLRVSCVRT